jgi:hypothetical protein
VYLMYVDVDVDVDVSGWEWIWRIDIQYTTRSHVQNPLVEYVVLWTLHLRDESDFVHVWCQSHRLFSTPQ